MINCKNLILTIFTFVLFLLSVPIWAQSASSDGRYDDRRDIGGKSRPDPPPADARMLNNPALINSENPSGAKTAPPSTINPPSPDGTSPLNPAGVDQGSPTGGTGGSTGY